MTTICTGDKNVLQVFEVLKDSEQHLQDKSNENIKLNNQISGRAQPVNGDNGHFFLVQSTDSQIQLTLLYAGIYTVCSSQPCSF